MRSIDDSTLLWGAARVLAGLNHTNIQAGPLVWEANILPAILLWAVGNSKVNRAIPKDGTTHFKTCLFRRLKSSKQRRPNGGMDPKHYQPSKEHGWVNTTKLPSHLRRSLAPQWLDTDHSNPWVTTRGRGAVLKSGPMVRALRAGWIWCRAPEVSWFSIYVAWSNSFFFGPCLTPKNHPSKGPNGCVWKWGTQNSNGFVKTPAVKPYVTYELYGLFAASVQKSLA